jgi:hypothetical protein
MVQKRAVRRHDHDLSQLNAEPDFPSGQLKVTRRVHRMVNMSTTRRQNVCIPQYRIDESSSHCHGFVTKLAASTDGES